MRSLHRFSLASLGLLLAAGLSCGDEKLDRVQAGVAPFGSDSRLHAVWLQVEGVEGAGQLRYFWDSDLEVECDFRVVQDTGEIRCLPRTTKSIGYFADPGCTRPAVWSGPGEFTLGDYVRSNDGGRCGPEPASIEAVFQLGAPSSVGYVLEQGCREQPSSDGRYFPVEKVEASRFALAHMQNDALMRRVVTKGGAWKNLYGRNNQGVACLPNGGGHTCVPAPVALGLTTYYDNDRCEGTNSAWAFTPADCSWLPSHSIASDTDPMTVHPVVEEISTHWQLDDETGVCSESQDWSPTLRVGPPIDIDTLPGMATHARGSGRIQLREVGWDPQSTLPAQSRFWDTHHDVECRPEELGGQYYCVPFGAPYTYGTKVWAGSCDGPEVWRTYSYRPDFEPEVLIDSDGDAFAFYEPIPVDGDLYFESSIGCELADRSTNIKYYIAGAQVPADSMQGWLTLHGMPAESNRN